MNIRVMSRSDFEKYAVEKHENRSIVISITSLDESLVTLSEDDLSKNNITAIIPVKANDTDKDEFGALTNQDATFIAEFIKSYYTPEITIIVHCGAGQSRSAGVAAAILKHYTNDDKQIFNNRRYTPNMLFYRRVLTALHYAT